MSCLRSPQIRTILDHLRKANRVVAIAGVGIDAVVSAVMVIEMDVVMGAEVGVVADVEGDVGVGAGSSTTSESVVKESSPRNSRVVVVSFDSLPPPLGDSPAGT